MTRSLARTLAVRALLAAVALVGAGVAPVAAQPTPGSCVGRTVTRPACPADATFSEPGGCQYEPRGFWQRLFGYRSHCRLADCGVCVTGELIDFDLGICCSPPAPSSATGVDFLLADHVTLGGSSPEGTNDLIHVVLGYQRFFQPPTFTEAIYRWSEFATYVNRQPTGAPAALRAVRAVSYGPAIGGDSGIWLYATGESGRSDCVRSVTRLPGSAAYLATTTADAEGRIYRSFRPPSFSEEDDFCPAGPGDDLVVTDGFVYTSTACGAGCDGRIFRLDRSTAEEALWLTVPIAEIGYWAGNFAFDAAGRLYLSSGNVAHGATIYRVDGVDTASPTFTPVYRRAEGPIMGFDFGPTSHLYFTEGSSRVYELRGFSVGSLFADFPGPPVRKIFDITFRD